MKFRYVIAAYLAIVLTSFCGTPLRGQAVSGAQISGQVLDPTGAVVTGVTVSMTQADTHYVRVAKTDGQGAYNLPNLPVGPYVLEVTATGFKRYEQRGIVLQVGSSVQIDANLEVGAASETVQVTTEAGGLVETRNNSISQVINEKQIADLPLNGRQATQLILVSGAATSAPPGNMISSKNYPSSVAISVAGGQGNGTNYVLDGGDNNDTFSNVNLPFPFPDALQEFSVETSVLPARNGLHPGALVNVVTKSGTNKLYGTAFEFIRDGSVNARNYFSTTQDSLRRNQYGGTVGGPIKKDKLFFFGGYQGTHNRSQPTAAIAFVPTPAALAGDFSALESAACQSNGVARTIVNPVTNTAYAGAQVPTQQFDPVALNVMKHLPVSTDPCGKITYGIPSTGDEDQFIGRGDYSRSAKHFLFTRYFLADYRNPAVYDPGDALVTQRAGNLERSQSFTFGDSYSFTPRIVNSLHITASRLRNNRGPAPDAYNAVSLGAKMYNYDSAGMQLTVSNAFTTNCGTCAPAVFNRNTFQEADDVDVLLGKHQIAFGVNIIRAQQNLNGHFNSNGLFQFNGTFSKDPMLDFLLGKMSSFGQSRSQVNVYRQTVPGLYIQDTFKVSTRLLINAGLRWEPQLFPQDLFGRGNTFSRQGFNANQHSTVYPNAPAGMLFYGDAGVPKAFTTDKLVNLSPRLGMVINPHGDGRDTFRFGAGLLYDTPEEYYAERLTTNAPYGGQIDQTNPGPLSDPWRNYPGGNPFPGSYPPTSSTTFPVGGTYAFIPTSLKPTYTLQWNASYESQVANDWLLSITYLGNKTSHLWLNLDINPAVYIPGQCGSAACSTATNTSQRRVLTLANATQGQYYGQVITTDDGANSFYNGLLASIQHRFSHGYTFLANHTWSHCISDGDFAGNLGNPQYQNQASRLADRGDCNFDIRHIFNATFVGTSPGFGNGWIRRFDKDWQVAPLVRMASGLPVNVLTGKDNSLTADSLDRPNLVPGARLYAATRGPNLQWFNAAALTANAIGTFGNLRRDTFRVPGQVNFDVSVSRIFPIRERFRLEARAEAFNVINHPNFGSPVASLSSSTFGRITSANDPRILQFSGKLHF